MPAAFCFSFAEESVLNKNAESAKMSIRILNKLFL